jgi:uncharacterized membrane protein
VFALYWPAIVVAFVITVTEMTEVVAVIFALGTDPGALGHGAYGAAAGTAVVGSIALGSGAALLALPGTDLLWGASVVLFAFGLFLWRSTLRSYRRARRPASAPSSATPGKSDKVVHFAGGFTVGAIETTEAVIVLLALTAAGYGSSAIVGAFLGGGILLAVAAAVHQRIRRIKVPTLKLGATSLLFTFAVFWAGEAGHVPWPFGDAILIALFLLALVLVRASLEAALRIEGNG